MYFLVTSDVYTASHLTKDILKIKLWSTLVGVKGTVLRICEPNNGFHRGKITVLFVDWKQQLL